MSLERRAFDRFIDSGELERLLAGDRLQLAIERVFESAGAQRAIDSFFDSGLFDRFVDRLLASDALWRLVDEIAQSPAVRAAISQQGLGFADQVGGELRGRSRKADAWIERTALRITRRHADEATPDGEAEPGRNPAPGGQAEPARKPEPGGQTAPGGHPGA